MKKEQMVGARLPEQLIADLEKIEEIEQTDRSTTVRKLLTRAVAEWRLEYYAEEYGRGAATLARAAEEARVSVWEMLDHLRLRRIPAQYNWTDLEHDLKVIYSRASKQTPVI